MRGRRVRLFFRDRARLLVAVIHHCAAARAEFGAMLDHAGGDFRDIGNFSGAKAERIARAHLLCIGAESKARGRENTEPESNRDHQSCPVKCLGHGAIPIACMPILIMGLGFRPASWVRGSRFVRPGKWLRGHE